MSNTEWQTIKVNDGTQMRVFIAKPQNASGAGIIVLPEIFGINAHIRDVAEKLAALGYLAIAPELFHRTAAPGFEGDYNDSSKSMPHAQALTSDDIAADARACYDWLAHNGAQAKRIGAVGFCLGGKAAFIANGVLPLRAASSFYGGSIPALLADYMASQHAPILFCWGGADQHIDLAARTAVAEGFRAARKPFTHAEFSEAGHGFFCDMRKSYDPNAAREAWALLKEFLSIHLG